MPRTKHEIEGDAMLAAASQRIAPIAAWVARHHGALAELARRLSKKAGRTIQYQYVQQMLALDPDKRVTPSYGMGIMLVKTAKEMMQEHNAALEGPYHTGPLKDLAYSMEGIESPPLDEED